MVEEWVQKRMKIQLRFWRSRNWVESTVGARVSRYGALMPNTGSPFPSSPMMDPSSEEGLSMYFDPIQPSVLSQHQLSGGGMQGQEGTIRSLPSSTQRMTNEMPQRSNPSVSGETSPNRTNGDALPESLQEMPTQPRQADSNIAVSSQIRKFEGVQSRYSQPTFNSQLNYKKPSQRFQLRSSQKENGPQKNAATPILEPLNAALRKTQQGITPSPQAQPSSLGLSPKTLQPIPGAGLLSAALKSKSPSQVPRQPSSRTVIPSLSIGFAESFSPSKALSSTSRMSKTPRPLSPLHSEPSTSRPNVQLPASDRPKDTTSLSSLQPPPTLSPIEPEAEPLASTRNARNVSRTTSPRFPPSRVHAQEGQDEPAAVNYSGAARSSARVVTQGRRTQASAADSQRQTQLTERGLMIVGRRSDSD